jgi:hypothetical protein
MTTGPITEKAQLLLLDSILHVASSAVKLIIESLGTPCKVGNHIPWIGAPITVFGLGNDPTLLVPALGFVLKAREESYLAAASLIFAFGSLLQFCR